MTKKSNDWFRTKVDNVFWLGGQTGAECRNCGKMIKKGQYCYAKPDEAAYLRGPYAPLFRILCVKCYNKLKKLKLL
jgi:hypothetical protein